MLLDMEVRIFEIMGKEGSSFATRKHHRDQEESSEGKLKKGSDIRVSMRYKTQGKTLEQ